MHPQEFLQQAATLMGAVLKFDQTAELVLLRHYRANPKLGARDRAMVTNAVFRVLRYKNLFEAQAKAAPRGMGTMERKLAILGLQEHVEMFDRGLTDIEREWLSVCSKVDIEALSDDLPAEQKHNLPVWLGDKLQREMGAHFWPLALAMLEPASLDIRTNTLKMKTPQLLEQLKSEGLEVEPARHAPDALRLRGKPNLKKHPLYEQGFFEVQDEGSQLIALLTQANRNEVVVDYCAGAGGKTLALGEMMSGRGRLYALDTAVARLEALKPRLERSGLNNVYPMAINGGNDERVQRLHGKVDCVLVDAPCTGLGTLRRNPDLKWRRKPEEVRRFQVQQLEILRDAAKLLKPGGRLIYATCSILLEENEDVAEFFTSHDSAFTPEPIADLLERQQVRNAAMLSCGGPDGRLYLRTWPQVHDIDGFFAAAWRKAA